MLLTEITNIFQYWISTGWYIALLMSFAVNLLVYFVTAKTLVVVSNKLNAAGRIGTFIDNRDLKLGQVKQEIKYGMIACFVFSVASLFSRHLFQGIWPESLVDLAIQLLAFTLFYETYSYFVHRLLHLNPFRRVHSVHHRSLRVTPWSAYSVHPVEALFIGLSAPLFMSFFPISLSVILAFHVIGMVFTLILHSNFVFSDSVPLASLLNRYTRGHALHHQKGRVNYGFVNAFWDKLLKTQLSA